MSLEIADDWLKFMELASSDIVIFVGKVPQSLLPYPKETIEEALGIVSQHLASVGNEEGLDGIKNSMAF